MNLFKDLFEKFYFLIKFLHVFCASSSSLFSSSSLYLCEEICECKKFGENLRQMASVSLICDEDCRLTRWPAEGIGYKVFSPGKL